MKTEGIRIKIYSSHSLVPVSYTHLPRFLMCFSIQEFSKCARFILNRIMRTTSEANVTLDYVTQTAQISRNKINNSKKQKYTNFIWMFRKINC